ncbi:MAG: ATP-binding cassette domain-containing protein, partial [Candidatus Heimdallarchaeota archaeon]|nr:ATP-binding cassette domain-containing protein [Candidatus Heimdallarchaeota archaeon]
MFKNSVVDSKNSKADSKNLAVNIKNLTYRYPDGNLALDNVSLGVAKGELIALLGPNGAGKSTLLLHLNGILTGSGLVEIFGEDITKKKRGEIIKEVGMVFQDPDDQLFMSRVFDDVAFGPMNMDLPKEEIEKRVTSSLKKVGMRGYENRCPHHLSSGEKKKIAIATILSMEPEIIVLDEPVSNLDPKSRDAILEILKELKSKGKTIIITTHDVNVVPEIADRIYILDKKIIAKGTPREIFTNAKLLKEANLDVPKITLLFEILACFGYSCDNLPLSIDDAVSHITQTIETKGGHIHLHLHEHTHDEIKKISRKY